MTTTWGRETKHRTAPQILPNAKRCMSAENGTCCGANLQLCVNLEACNLPQEITRTVLRASAQTDVSLPRSKANAGATRACGHPPTAYFPQRGGHKPLCEKPWAYQGSNSIPSQLQDLCTSPKYPTFKAEHWGQLALWRSCTLTVQTLPCQPCHPRGLGARSFPNTHHKTVLRDGLGCSRQERWLFCLGGKHADHYLHTTEELGYLSQTSTPLG